MRRAGWLRAGASIAAALTLVGFGGGGSGADDFRDETDELCVEEAKAIGEVIAEVGAPQTVEEDGVYREELQPIREDTLGQLEELEPPRRLESDFEDYVANYEELLALDEEFIELAPTGDQPTAEGINAEQGELAAENRQLADDMGLNACAEQLSRKEERKVRAEIEETFLNGDTDFCTERYTEAFVESIGGLEACEEAEEDPANAVDAIEIEDIRGVDQVFAVAMITPEGGPVDGEPGIVELEYEDGVYKRSALFAAPQED